MDEESSQSQHREESLEQARDRLQRRMRELVKDEKVAQSLIDLYAGKPLAEEVRGLGFSVKNLELTEKLRAEGKLQGLPQERGCLGHIFDHVGISLMGVAWAWFVVRAPAWIGHPVRTVSYVLIWLPFIALLQAPAPSYGRAPIQGSHKAFMFLTCAVISLYLWLSGY